MDKLKLIETDCNCDLLSLFSLKVHFYCLQRLIFHEISAFYSLGVYQLRSPTNGRN